PTQVIKFYDDIFALREDEWLEEFSEKYPKEVGLPFHCLVRADILTEGMLLKLKKAGIQSISMSIEAGNEFVREHKESVNDRKVPYYRWGSLLVRTFAFLGCQKSCLLGCFRSY
ncbi:MAG: hypothetical protein QMD05_08930, partial [Candidatus Brocadiaceae bacterium]|nr:hypothetical protein [Candidatus Brocadiaceae bacterium]